MQTNIVLIIFAIAWKTAETDDEQMTRKSICHKNFLPLNKYYTNSVVTRNDSETRIIQGIPARLGQFPWQVAIDLHLSYTTFFCGGSLIGAEWVLTASHCVSGGVKFTLHFGGTNLQDKTQKIVAHTYIEHPFYDPETLNNDVGLIRLPKKIKYTETIQPVALAPAQQFIDGAVDVTVAGWGVTSDNAMHTSVALNFAHLTTFSNDKCVEYYGNDIIISSTLCAIGSGLHNTCSGDSGGPLVMYDANGEAMQVGIISFVHKFGCESGYPSGFVRVASYRNWIREKTGI